MTVDLRPTLLLIGASVRAFAESAVRGGFSVWCCDFFGDRDLTALGPWVRVVDYPGGFLDAIKSAPPGPVIYTGGLENYPLVLAAIGAERDVVGCGPDVLREVRNPWRLRDSLTNTEFAFPETIPITPATVQAVGERVQRGERWLLKRLTGSGGSHLRWWSESLAAIEVGSNDLIAQRWEPGVSLSAQYLATNTGVELLGLCFQRGCSQGGTTGDFRFSGAIGPLPLMDNTEFHCRELGRHVATDFGLSGLFGIDLIWPGEHDWTGQAALIWPVETKPTVLEVNPRYTASMELFERFTGRSLVAEQFAGTITRPPSLPPAAELKATTPAASRKSGGENSLVDSIRYGKAIVYADRAVRFGTRAERLWLDQPELLADIPADDGVIVAGAPVATVFGWAPTLSSVETMLRTRIDELRCQLDPVGD